MRCCRIVVQKRVPWTACPALLLSSIPFVAAIRHQTARGKNEWQQEIRIERPEAPLVLLIRGSRLPMAALPGEAVSHGHVIVFDDVTVLNQAQRDAAWSEVARRLAHEVKNPLTPIRLAAERPAYEVKRQAGIG